MPVGGDGLIFCLVTRRADIIRSAADCAARLGAQGGLLDPVVAACVGLYDAEVGLIAAVNERNGEVLGTVRTEALVDCDRVREHGISRSDLRCAINRIDAQIIGDLVAVGVVDIHAVKALRGLVTLDKALVQDARIVAGFELGNEVIRPHGQVAFVADPVDSHIDLLLRLGIGAHEPKRLHLAGCRNIDVLGLLGVRRSVDVAVCIRERAVYIILAIRYIVEPSDIVTGGFGAELYVAAVGRHAVHVDGNARTGTLVVVLIASGVEIADIEPYIVDK